MQYIENIDEKLNTITHSLTQLNTDQPWPTHDCLNKAITQSIDSLPTHLATLKNHASALLKTGDETHASAQDIERIFHEWHIDKNPPSLLSMCVFFIKETGLSPAPDDFNMLAVAAILGQVHNEVPYHNDMHFRKVLAQSMRLIVNHTAIYDGTARALDTHQICTLLTAACIHDLAHDGQGNVVKGVHIQGRAEKHSFNLAKPYLTATGCEQETLNALYVMLLTTDVSPLDDPANPMMQMKSAYRFHFMGEDAKTHSINLSNDIRALEKDKTLSTLCLLLHEADIATSASMTYDVTKFETSLIMEEFRKDAAHPIDVINFLDRICQRRFLSDAGQKLFAANLGRIYALAQQDVQDGNEAYPPSHHADFALPKQTSNSTSVN